MAAHFWFVSVRSTVWCDKRHFLYLCLKCNEKKNDLIEHWLSWWKSSENLTAQCFKLEWERPHTHRKARLQFYSPIRMKGVPWDFKKAQSCRMCSRSGSTYLLPVLWIVSHQLPYCGWSEKKGTWAANGDIFCQSSWQLACWYQTLKGRMIWIWWLIRFGNALIKRHWQLAVMKLPNDTI